MIMKLQDLLGRPIHSPEIKEFFAQYHLPQNPLPNHDAYGNLFWVHVNNKEKTIYTVFTGYVRYAPIYGEPIGSYNKAKDQLILHEKDCQAVVGGELWPTITYKTSTH